MQGAVILDVTRGLIVGRDRFAGAPIAASLAEPAGLARVIVGARPRVRAGAAMNGVWRR